MTGLEVAVAAAGRSVAKRAGREWLAARAAATDRDKDLTELIRVSFPDRFARRKLELFGLRVDNFRPRATLSVAYISLTATAEDRVQADDGPLKMAALTGDRPERAPATARAEEMLARSSRTLLRGQAGSGKSTLLGWIAVTAARSAFTGDLRDWNGRVPFLIKLRSWSEGALPRPEDFVTGPLAGLTPAGWAHRVLDAGREILLCCAPSTWTA